MENPDDARGEFIKKRESFSIEMRRQYRQEVLSKRRNLENEQNNIDGAQNQNDNIQYIVDPRYKQYTKKFYKAKNTLQNLQELRKAMNDPDIIRQHYGTIGIRKIMSLIDNPPIQAIIDLGVVPRLIEFVSQEEYPQLQLEATWTLANVASGTTQQCQSIINKGAIQLFIHLLKSPHEGIIEQAVWAVGNIASDSAFNRDNLIKAGAIPAMIQLIKNTSNQKIITSCLWALSNLCRTFPLPNYETVKDAILLIGQLLPKINSKQQVFIDCCWAISYNFPTMKDQYEKIITTQFIVSIISKLKESSNNYTLYSSLVSMIRVLMQISGLGSDYIEIILESKDIISYFCSMLYHDKKIVRLNTCIILSNIASSQQKYINQIFGNEKILVKLLEMFETDVDFIKKQLCCFFANLTIKGHPETILGFYNQMSIVKCYLDKLSTSNTNVEVIVIALKSLFQIIKFGEQFKINGGENPIIRDMVNHNGLPIIEALQMHDSTDVYSAVIAIMISFFEIEDGLNL